jgi:hypothetical protein
MTEESESQQLIDCFSDLAGKEFIRLFGQQKGDALHRLYERQFRIHYNNYSQMMPNPLAKRHGINTLFVMAVDDVLREVKASYSQLRKSILAIYREMLLGFFGTETASIKQSKDPWNAFIEWVQRGNKGNYENEFFKLVEVHKNDKEFGFDIQRCFYFDILREAGRPELGQILCEYDGILASVVDTWIRFTRNETIASGDKRCTFRYERI